jgi:hypothetical protein
MGDSNLRIEGYAPGYQGAGAGGAFVAPRFNRAQRFHVLFATIDAGDMEAAQHALTAVLNFDPKLAQDVEFAKLAKAVHDKHVYAAQHFAHDYQVRLAHQVEVLASHRPLTDHTMESSAHRHLPDDGLPHVDAMA